MKVRVKSWNEIKDSGWAVDEMRVYCGRVYEICDEVDDRFVHLRGCGDWQFARDGVEII